MIIEGVTVHAFDSKNWVVHTPQGRNFLVNHATYQLFQILRSCSNLANALEQFNSQFSANLNEQQFGSLVAEKLGGYHILTEDESVEKPTLKNQYLKLKFELINPRWAGILSKPFQVFYAPNVFWWALLTSGLVIMSIYFGSNTTSLNKQTDYFLLSGLFYATMLIHELGHIAACARCGLKHGGIGFGFYFILPVMYADITNIWLANKQQRIIANMAGIFSELFYAAMLGILFLIINNATFLTASIGISSFVLWEFNPFVRFDGYWILSDLTNTPNLLPKANTIFKNVLKAPKQLLNFDFKTKMLFLYGFINTAFLVAIMGYTLIAHWEAVVHFPITLWSLIKKAFYLNLSRADLGSGLITVLIFYILVIRLLVGQYQRILLKLKPLKNEIM
jgi:putative peptide zinc metalloprotease protein